jgi:murein DD-endopeptidase MepM/ murein hydrolase activator NlpD
MKSATPNKGGSEPRLDRNLCLFFAAMLFLISGVAGAQALYKYQDENGEWVFTDRAPPEEQSAEILELPTGKSAPTVTVTTSLVGRQVRFSARNEYVVPVEVVLALDALHNLELPPPDQSMRWVVAPQSELVLLTLAAVDDNVAPEAEYRFVWIPGNPDSQHDASHLYRAPFAVAKNYPITQAFPVGITHLTPDSYYAVDLAMPVGTDIYAARAGTVFEVASTNFSGGMDAAQDIAKANIVRIMHDDGSQAAYAHLNWNSIRVRPGDRVERGQYIADSGNTGFSSGPHLHFVVMVNLGMRLASVPVLFEGPNRTPVEATTGNTLVAY